MKYSEWEECFLDGACQFCCVIFSSGCSGDGMKIVGFILAWGLPQTQRETGKGIEGTCKEVFVVRDHSSCSRQGLTCPQFYIFNTSIIWFLLRLAQVTPVLEIFFLGSIHSPYRLRSISCLFILAKFLKNDSLYVWSLFPHLSSFNPL